MKITISDCISRINQALNYPAISYEDVSHFFDQAIAELNTSLRIALPNVTEMRFENTFRISEHEDTIPLNPAPNSSETATYVSNVENIGNLPTPPDGWPIRYYCATNFLDRVFYIYKNGSWKPVQKAYGVDSSGRGYETVKAGEMAAWREVPLETVTEFDLTTYLPTDWIILFLIPYVCFKFAVRNGDNGALFSDEFTQGFQQLQTSYNVPNTVTLSTVAHLPAYKQQVLDNIGNLNVKVTTRAISEKMRVPNGIRTISGATFMDGGWGI